MSDLVELGFMDARIKMIDIAAFLDRVQRHGQEDDYRVRALKEERFDWAMVLPDSHRAALAPWLARIPVRVGYARDAGRRLMLTQSLAVPQENGKRKPVSMALKA